MKTIKTAALLICTLLLASCQNLQGERQGDYYFSPAGAYILDMSINTFRGEVVLDERCDRQGGSTTFWDGSGRLFRVDYLSAEDHPMIQAPRFASDLTLLNLTLNSYLREVVAKAPMITSAEASYREFLEDACSPLSASMWMPPRSKTAKWRTGLTTTASCCSSAGIVSMCCSIANRY